MTRITLLAGSLVAFGFLPAAAQAPAAKPDISKTIVGTWEGPYHSEAVPPGSLKLAIARGPKQEWQVTLEVLSDDPPPADVVREFTVDGNTVSWVQTISDMECRSAATLVAGVLKGTAECTQGGAVVLTAAFLLEKKKP